MKDTEDRGYQNLRNIYVYYHIKVTINSLKSKFSLNLVFKVLQKLNLFSLVGIFVRILYKENLIVIDPFEMGGSFCAAHLYFWELINPINKCN